MSANYRVLRRHRLSSHDPIAVSTKFGLLESRVYSLQPMQSLLERIRQAVVCLHLVDKSGIAANLWAIKDVQERRSRWLLLIGDIRVPSDTAVTIGEKGLEFALATVPMYQMDLRIALWRAAGRVNVMTAEVSSEIKCFLDRQVSEVLVSECDHFALGNEQGELILAGRGQLAELDTSDF